MSNYAGLRMTSGSSGSKYLLDSSFDYYTSTAGYPYGKNDRNDYSGSRVYNPGQYNTTFDVGRSDLSRNDYKPKYEKYLADSTYGGTNGKKEQRDQLRNTTSILPSYSSQHLRGGHSYLTKEEQREYDRRPMKTTYEVPASSRTNKNRDVSPNRQPSDKSGYLSPSKYTSSSTANALSPSHYTTKYDKKAKIDELFAKIKHFPSAASPPTSPRSPRQQAKTKQQLIDKYKNYISAPKFTSSSSTSSSSDYVEYKKNDYIPTYNGSSYTDSKKYSKKEEQYTNLQLADSKSVDPFKKKKDNYRDVKSPFKDNDKRVGGYVGSTTSKKEENHKLTDSKVNYSKPSSPSYGLSPSSPKFDSKVTISDFKIGKSKGEGKFGQVFAARHKQSGTLYALKMIPKEKIKESYMIDQLVLEIKLQMFLNHPNILKLYTFFSDYENVYLVLEYMEEGTLFQHLKKRIDRMTQKEVARRITEISKAIQYLHDLNIAHRDIKPQNIVMSNGMAKLCDFGWATICNNRRKTYCGTFDYVAPEILEGKEYDWCVDLWCLGVLTYELLMGKVPFYDISRKETMKKILSCGSGPLVFSSDISWDAKDFVECLIKKAPEERRHANQLLDHPFLQRHKQQQLNIAF